MELTLEQRKRIEENRKKALLIRQEKSKVRVSAQPYQKPVKQAQSDKNVVTVAGQSYVDTEAGFLLNEDDLSDKIKPVVLAQEPNPILPKTEQPTCIECNQEFGISYLMTHFDHPVCDRCKEKSGKDKFDLITKTEAKKEYLLKDCDIDLRPPPLRYILGKNPHNSRWGEMKLYLLLQVEKRALEVWGSEEEVERQIELRQEKQKISKLKTYKKKVKELRMSTRSSLYTKVTKASHEHEFDAEIYNEEDDNYERTCSSCGFHEIFEKM
ncbi:Putative DNA-binding domain,XPA, conserved site,XPA,XPA C- terminal,Zinc finger, XPA-type, conserved [Cinara cedri]|uniref:DNA-binding domain,XPA, conserved site,XPA,XPA C- terminal,Zinc finger, XPA-type, conserved n=1 Tax=Cinara cedri TaxID=506608 RepID=A0A5E4MLX3_9HEMI|nr:Putative DNA-binding domain,XPA, conserved site,XPA,XPA C- terminal,Zinc finger, XPA-type, conserved [Cinara cedri]